MRIKMIETDTIDCIIALGKNLFYNSSMESALLIRRTNKEANKKGKILFINAFEEVRNEKNISYLLDEHIEKIHKTYINYENVEGFARVVDKEEILKSEGSLLVTKYIKSTRIRELDIPSIGKAYSKWIDSGSQLKASMNHLFNSLR